MVLLLNIWLAMHGSMYRAVEVKKADPERGKYQVTVQNKKVGCATTYVCSKLFEKP